MNHFISSVQQKVVCYRFTHLYTKWSVSEEEHSSEQQSLLTKQPKTEVNFNDHHSVPLASAVASDVMARFMDVPFLVEVIIFLTVNHSI